MKKSMLIVSYLVFMNATMLYSNATTGQQVIALTYIQAVAAQLSLPRVTDKNKIYELKQKQLREAPKIKKKQEQPKNDSYRSGVNKRRFTHKKV